MAKMKLYWEFYKTTVLINWGFSFVCSLLLFRHFALVLPVSILAGGHVLALIYKEFYKKQEYFFYHNLGISKMRLILLSLLINGFVGSLFLMTFSYVRAA